MIFLLHIQKNRAVRDFKSMPFFKVSNSEPNLANSQDFQIFGLKADDYPLYHDYKLIF